MANLPSEKVNELKQLIHNHLNQIDVHSKIKDCLNEESFAGQTSSDHDHDQTSTGEEDRILGILREKGLIDEVMRTLKFEGTESSDKKDVKNKHKNQHADKHKTTEKTTVPKG